ncbi:COQ9 family protein [Aerophototrophica crusticola]|uniref:COQ9 family protein n=1 Tax=Aerophototrophica crusticola TaxID=1709002 RepID=A0A858R4P8_9PROT|nr:COQ9 family protein [Rhodospirillaceae bacterium B3]
MTTDATPDFGDWPEGSYSEGSFMDELTARRDAILEAMLPEVAFDGWTRAALLRAAESAGYPKEEALAAFPDGMAQVVEHFSGWADRKMLDRLAEQDLMALKVRERVTLAVRTRLEVLGPHKEAVRRSASFLALPQVAGLGPRILYRTVDAMWLAAGDTSTDYNFYTKRLLLGGVVASTTLVWLDDRSEGNEKTWSFLDRRINDVMAVGKGIGQLKNAGSLLSKLPTPGRLAKHFRAGMR